MNARGIRRQRFYEKSLALARGARPGTAMVAF